MMKGLRQSLERAFEGCRQSFFAFRSPQRDSG
nr:MAG TPA: hypothetical protein [Caudoviricetes sp.]DAP46694.1 MAG TPA: hypothetical protein [Caudoviricetes sp.]